MLLDESHCILISGSKINSPQFSLFNRLTYIRRSSPGQHRYGVGVVKKTITKMVEAAEDYAALTAVQLATFLNI